MSTHGPRASASESALSSFEGLLAVINSNNLVRDNVTRINRTPGGSAEIRTNAGACLLVAPRRGSSRFRGISAQRMIIDQVHRLEPRHLADLRSRAAATPELLTVQGKP